MAITITPVVKPPDGTFSPTGSLAWTSGMELTGATATRIPYVDTGGLALTDSGNLLYTETSGPRLQVGSSGTSAGLRIGYSGASGSGAIWNSSLTPSLTNYALYIDATTSYLNGSAGCRLAANGVVKLTQDATAGVGPAITAGTATTDVNALSATQTWNASGVAFTFADWTITDTASAAGSLAFRIRGGAAGTTNLFTVRKDGGIVLPNANAVVGSISGPGSNAAISIVAGPAGSNSELYLAGAYSTPQIGLMGFRSDGVSIAMASTQVFGWTSGAANGTIDAAFSRGGANHIVHAAATGGGGTATSRAEINKSVTAFTDAVAKTVFTLTIPNAAHSASYLVRITGSIGAGGAVGANEASATNCYVVTLTRTAGVNAVAGISTAFGGSTAAVAGATTVTCTAALAAVSGAVGASNTIDIQATITKGGGASDNHTCVATASLLNANATGISIA